MTHMEIVGEVTAGQRFRRIAGLVMLAAAVCQAVAAVLFFFAANWWSLPPLAKTGAVDAGLLAAALAAALAPAGSFGRDVAATAGAVLTGVLFAVHGQTWQTGADAWELFAVWSAAALGWALVSRDGAAWLLAASLASLGTWGWLSSAVPESVLDERWAAHGTALAPLAFLGLRAALRPGGRWIDPLLFAAAAALLVLGGLIGTPMTEPFLVAALAIGAALGLGTPERFGPWPRAVALAAAAVLSGGAGARLALESVSDSLAVAGLLLGLAGLLLAGMAGMARYLVRRVDLPPVATGLAVGAGVWLAALIAVGGFVALTEALHFGAFTVNSLLGAVLSAGLAAWNRHREGTFAGHASAAFAVVAFGMALASVASGLDDTTAAALAALPLLAGVVWLARERQGAALAGFMAAGVAATLWAQELEGASALLPPFCALAGWLALRDGRPALRGAGLALLCASFGLAPLRDLFEGGPDLALRAAEMLAAAGLYWESARREPALREPRLLGAAAALLAGAPFVPAGGAGLVGLAALAAERRSPLLLAAGLGCGAWSIVRAYWEIEMPLDQKAALLALGAVLALAGLIAMSGIPRFAAVAPRRAAVVLFLACAAVPAAAEAVSAHAKRQVVEQGTEILLPIAPADPRSLVQGDYMALRYPEALIGGLPAGGGRALLELGPDRVVRGVRLSDAPAGPGEVALRLRSGRERPRLAPDSFLFEEGTAKSWQAARFVMARVSGERLVVTGMADETLTRIQPVRE